MEKDFDITIESIAPVEQNSAAIKMLFRFERNGNAFTTPTFFSRLEVEEEDWVSHGRAPLREVLQTLAEQTKDWPAEPGAAADGSSTSSTV